MSYYDPPEQNVPECPICGTDMYEYIYKDTDGKIVGCDNCVSICCAAEWWEELGAENEPDPDYLYDQWREEQLLRGER